MQAIALEPLSVPANFPVNWEDPADEKYFWTQDRMHFPVPLTRADADLLEIFSVYGFSRVCETFGMPFRMKMRLINAYEYQSAQPVTDDPLELERMGAELEAKMGAAMAELGTRWESVQLPEIQDALSAWQAFDLQGVPTSELVAHLNAALDTFRRLVEIHFEVVLPSYMAMSMFDDFYRDLFGGEDAFAGYTLLQGFSNKTVESGLELWKLSRVALSMPEVGEALGQREVQDVLAALAGSEAGRAFKLALNDYLAEYGQRGGQLSLAPKSWIEDPSPAIELLKEYMNRPEYDLPAELESLAAQREEHLTSARNMVVAYPAQVREHFEFLLAAAQTGTILSEDHNFYIDFAAVYQLRRILLEFGRRLAMGGVIASTEDVFHLSIEEMKTALAGSESPKLATTIQERKAEIAHYSQITPPPALGTPPAGPPPDDPGSRAMGKFFGLPPAPPTEPSLLKGAAGSRGVVQGRVKVARTLEEASKLKPGDILVAATTNAAWTPLFATVAAVVTDTGGVLCHGAVVAREYGLPAVVGVGFATTVLKDGQLVEVDGGAGTIRVIDAV